MHHMHMKCPVLLEEDRCGKDISINFWKAEPATWTYPGAPRDFEVDECDCGHKDLIEDQYTEEVWEEVRDREIGQLEYAAEQRYDSARDDRMTRDEFLMARW